MANITVTFEYDIPDDYLYQTNDLGKKGTFTYHGPDYVWAHVDMETRKLAPTMYKTEQDGGEDFPHPINCYVVKIDCAADPLIACLLRADEGIDYGSLPQHTETLPDGTTYTRPLSPPPDHTYEASEIDYDPETNTFVKPYPWKKPHMTWDGIRAWRSQLLSTSDGRVLPDVPATLRNAWKEHRTRLRNLPQVHGASSSVSRKIDTTAASPINKTGQNVLQLANLVLMGDVDPTAKNSINKAGQDVIQLVRVIGLQPGMVVTGIDVPEGTNIVSVDIDDKQVTLSEDLESDLASNGVITFTTVGEVDGIEEGMTVLAPMNQADIFGETPNDYVHVVSVDPATKQVTLDASLARDLTNISLTFYYKPSVDPWKVQPYTDPSGKM